MKIKKVPLRKCIACGNRFEKKELIRIVKNSDGEIILDESGKLNGRGCYICTSEECLALVIKKKLLNRTFKTEVDEGVFDNLKEKICK